MAGSDCGVGAADPVPATASRAPACLLTTCGLPGAGKSTLVRALAAFLAEDGPGASFGVRVSHVCFDDIERWVEDCYNGEEGEKVERAAGALEGFDLDAEEAVLPDEDNKVVIEMQPTAMLGGSNQPPLVDRLRELTAAKESGVLSEEEFQAARKHLLDQHVSSM